MYSTVLFTLGEGGGWGCVQQQQEQRQYMDEALNMLFCHQQCPGS
jgi:hypothetical protein